MPASLPPNSFYVVSYPRSGNTWLINCLTQLLGAVRGEAYTPFDLYTEQHGTPGDGFHFWCEPRRDPRQPVCVKSHDDLVTFRTRHPPGPVVYIARDARDSLLSYYFFQQAYAGGELLEVRQIQQTDVLISRGKTEPRFEPGAFLDFLRREAPRWAAHVRSATQSADVCFLTYEQLQRDFEPTLQRVIRRIGLPLAGTFAETQAVYHTGFGKVFAGNNRDFFRRGQIGDWMNWYGREHAALVEQLVGPELREFGFEPDPAWAAAFTPRPAPARP